MMDVRLTTENDLDAIVALRLRLLSDTGELVNGPGLPDLVCAIRTFFAESFASGTSLTWLVEVDGVHASVSTLSFFHRPPFPGHLLGTEAYLSNMYTLPMYRRQGCSKSVLRAALAHARLAQVGRVWLHASAVARPMYESMGFRQSGQYLEWS